MFVCLNVFHVFLTSFYLFILERGREGEREGEKSMCGCPSCAPCWGSGLQPGYVPWLGIEPVTLWFTGWCSIHWATPAKAVLHILSWVFNAGSLTHSPNSTSNQWCILIYFHENWILYTGDTTLKMKIKRPEKPSIAWLVNGRGRIWTHFLLHLSIYLSYTSLYPSTIPLFMYKPEATHISFACFPC